MIESILSTFEKIDSIFFKIESIFRSQKKRLIRSKNRCSNSQPWLKVSTRPTEWIGGSHQHLRWRKFTPVFKKRPYSTQRAFVNITIPTQKWHRCTPITNLKMPSFLRFPFVKSGSITEKTCLVSISKGLSLQFPRKIVFRYCSTLSTVPERRYPHIFFWVPETLEFGLNFFIYRFNTRLGKGIRQCTLYP